MKLTAIIIFAACLQVSARGDAQTVSISVSNASLEKVFQEIKKQTGYKFFYEGSILNEAKKVSVSVRNASLEDVLNLCFKDQPLTYTIIEKTILIKKKETTSPNEDATNLTIDDSRLTIDITGKVTDADGNPLIGASVKVKGISLGTTTNSDGVFVLKGVDADATLEISFVGYETYTVAVNNKATLVASLKIKPENLNEVIINKGYYTEEQKLSTSNVYSVKAKDIQNQPVNNPLLALIGRVPGLNIQQQTGFANSGIIVRIEGKNSINSGLDPLYVVDGLPYLSLSLPTIGDASSVLGASSESSANGGNPLSFINPNDIESIDVLKDADATAIYGSRGANGVILITTKKGKPGQTRVNANFRSGWGKVKQRINLMNTEQYLALRKEGYLNDGKPVPDQTTAPSNSNYDLTVWDQNKYTDWQDVLFGGTAKYTDAQTSVSGGNSNTQFLLSSGYHKETTVFPADFSDQKATFQLNLNNTSSNQRFKIQTSALYTFDNNRIPYKDLTNVAIKLAPNAPDLYNSDGSFNWAPLPNGNSTWTNPLADINTMYQNKVLNLISNLQISYQVFSFLKISSRFGYNNQRYDELEVYPLSGVRPELRASTTNGANYGNSNINGWTIEPQVTYTAKILKGELNALAGTSFQKNTVKNQPVFGSGYSSDLLLSNLSAASKVTPLSVVYSQYKYNAIYGRLNYNLKDKYIINATGRRDGSSRFGSSNLFSNFWSIAGGWIFTNEKWLSPTSKFLNYGKLKVSYGTSGNDQIGDYGFINLYNPLTAGVPYEGITALAPNQLTNPHLQWEKTNKLQLGLDLSFINDRVNFNINYYRNHSSNLLVRSGLSIVSGFTKILQNFPGVIENEGWEISVNSSNIRGKDFTWTTNFNLTIPHHNGQIISFPNIASTSYVNNYVVGKSLYDVRSPHFLFVDPTNGIYQFEDIHGNPTTLPSTKDNVGFLNQSQRLYGGIQNTITFKSFTLDFTLQGVKRKALLFTGDQPGSFSGTSNKGNQPSVILNRWQKTGDVAPFQKSSAAYSNINTIFAYIYFTQSDGALTDASFIRLTNLSFSWQVPANWKKAVHLQNAQLFLQGQNLFTITKFKGLDPSSASSVSNVTLPPLQIITLGANITF